MGQLLKDYALTHGGINPVHHPQLQCTVWGQTAIRYLRFLRPVRLERLELPRAVYGRWVPQVPTHPAHLIISVLDRPSCRWEKVQEVDLPPDPRIWGEGLSQEMTTAEMDARLAQVLREPPLVIPLDGLVSDHLRVECDREHPVWPSHGECNGGVFNVPFGILDPLRAYGEPLPGARFVPTYRPILRQGTIRPAAPRGMRLEDRPEMLLFAGPRLAVGFSLRRPLLMHLGWDALGQGQAEHNRLLVSRRLQASNASLGGLSGPLLRTLATDYGAHQWMGEVTVEGNRVAYRRLRCGEALTLDAVFTVEPDRLLLELTQTCAEPLPVLEAEAWRWAWNLAAGITGAAAEPTLAPGRNGDVHLPILWASDGVGCLAVGLLQGEGEHTRFQVESYRACGSVTGGLVLAPRPPADGALVLPAGTRRAMLELAVTNLEPLRPAEAPAPSTGLRRHWATVFACFRPELRGFSNHAASTNCHLSQAAPMEVVVHTRRPAVGPDPIALARYTVARALLDGGGYGYWRNLYLDSDPVLVSAAGRIHQARPDLAWLRRIEPGLLAAVERMGGTIGEEGLVVCRDLSGNSGSFRWSSNGMDVVGFGHIDAYVNAWTYRALRNAAALLGELGRAELAQRCREQAAHLRAAYAPCLLNPETGWVAGWRSRDGALHDYAFIFVNGVAIAFGLLEPPAARRALEGLERLRDEVGPGLARLGLPCNLWPISPQDHMLPQITGEHQPTFETYTDGSLSAWPATYYLRALALYGLEGRARALAAELDEGYAAGIFSGGFGSGHEFRSWEGLPTGYEGTLIGCFASLYALAILQGQLRPPEPEWWPAGG